MRKLGLTLLSVGLLALGACQPKSTGSSATASSASTSPPVAVVNGVPISRDFFEFYVRGITRGKSSADLTQAQRELALDNLVRAQIVAQVADKEGLAADQNTKFLLELSRLNVLQQTVSERYLKDRKPTDQELRAEYETQVANMPHEEYHVRHIMVATEPFAEKLVGELDKGAKFADVAKQESMDSSKQNGGDLGWVTPDRAASTLGKPFVDAFTALKPGEYTHTPVQSAYGWHIIFLEGTRALPPPPYDNSVQQQLVRIVEEKKFRAYVDGLMKNAKIEKKL